MGFEIENGVLKSYTDEPGVTEAVIPESVRKIVQRSFAPRSDLTCITIPESVTFIEHHAFYFCDQLETIIVDEKNPCFFSEDGLLYDRKDGTLLFCPLIRTRVMLRRELRCVESYAFVMGGLFLKDIFVRDSRTDVPMHLRLTKFFKVVYLMASLRESYAEIGDTNLKYQTAVYDFVHGLNEEAGRIVRKSFSRIVTMFMDFGDVEMLEALFAVRPPNAKQLDKFLAYAIEKEMAEIQLFLMNYKNQNGGYAKGNRFQL